jgi:hypothetical protein
MNPELKKLLVRIAATLTISLLALTPALAVEYVDVEQPVAYAGVYSGEWHQVFTPNANNITAVSVYCNNSTGVQNVRILDGVCGTVLAHGTIATAVGWVKCDLVGAQALVPGQPYAIYVGPNFNPLGQSGWPYPGGDAYYDSCSQPYGSFDIAFRTWTDEEAVPSVERTWGAVKGLYR